LKLKSRNSGTQILIHSFAYYIENAIVPLLQKGAIPIISSQTPNNIWSNGVLAGPNRFVTYAKSIGTRRSITYVDHFAYTAQAYNSLGETKTTTFYPNDHLHTNAAGALVVAQAFVRGLLCSNNALKAKVNSAGQGVPGMYPIINVRWILGD
jgi:rhamnogalacturonan acetylesterase